MSYEKSPYQAYSTTTVANTGVDERADFIRKTYLHLGGAVGIFVALLWGWMQVPGIENLVAAMFGSPMSWLLVLGAFMVVSYVANKWALTAVSPGMQYAGLGLYVFAESIIFVPIIWIATIVYEPRVGPIVMPAAVTTISLFAVLTAIVFFTAKDFSFLRTALMVGGFAAMGAIVVGVIWPELGIFNLVFICAMIVFACGYILYDTSNVLHHYRPGQHIAASLALFASVALLFWYILQLFMRLSRD